MYTLNLQHSNVVIENNLFLVRPYINKSKRYFGSRAFRDLGLIQTHFEQFLILIYFLLLIIMIIFLFLSINLVICIFFSFLGCCNWDRGGWVCIYRIKDKQKPSKSNIRKVIISTFFCFEENLWKSWNYICLDVFWKKIVMKNRFALNNIKMTH